MDLNNYFNTEKKKITFKATVREKTKGDMKILKFFVKAYDKRGAMEEAVQTLKQEHPNMDASKISVEEL